MKKIFFMGTIIAAVAFLMASEYSDIIANASGNDSAVVKEVKATGEALIGGPFELVNQKGEKVTEKNYAGRLMLVFFGFTNCPAICPTGMLTISKTMEVLEDKAAEVVPVFITVDAENDTQEKIAIFLSNFNPAIQGLTGTEEQLKKAAENYKVFARKMEDDSMQTPMFNHSTFIYLMSRDGKYITHFSHEENPEKIVKAVLENL